MFGSSANGTLFYYPFLSFFEMLANLFLEMCFVNGDIDMCLTIDKSAGPEKNVVNKLSNLLERSMFHFYSYFDYY